MKRLAMSVEAPYRILLLNELNVFFRYDDDAMARKEVWIFFFQFISELILIFFFSNGKDGGKLECNSNGFTKHPWIY